MTQSILLTDFYQLTMGYGYWQLCMHEQQAVFHLFYRRPPKGGDYVIAAGLSELIDSIQNFGFSSSDIDYLRSLRRIENKPYFSDDFLYYLSNLHFSGDIDAVPEGSLVLPEEPLLRIKAPILIAQLLETLFINSINFASAVATMASRIRFLVENNSLFEFGLRRAQGSNGGLTASRSAYIGGFDSTSNVLAGKQFGIPVVGTMAHSWVMAFEHECEAFENYATLMPDNSILLVDTYNTKEGILKAIQTGKILKQQGHELKGIRLDSGDLSELSKMARTMLNEEQFYETKIFVSGDLTEEKIRELKLSKAPIDGFGVGTKLSTVYDQPALDMVYKLSAIQKNNQWRYTYKISDTNEKTSNPGILQTRRYQKNEQWIGDVIYHTNDDIHRENILSDHYQDLLIPIFRDEKRVYQESSIANIRKYCMEQVKTWNNMALKPYQVKKDFALEKLKKL